MASNKTKREELEKIYGKGSMFQKAKTEEYISTLPKIKGYKKFVEEKHFTSKEIKALKKRMNYHHLQHKAEGGATSIENGAVIDELEHRYIHSLPRNQEEIINNHIRQWKLDFITLTTEAVIDSEEISIDLNHDFIEIPVKEYKGLTKKELIQKQRRKEKREMQKLKKEYEER